jgi:hypothetical protein
MTRTPLRALRPIDFSASRLPPRRHRSPSFDKLRQVSQATIVENKHLGAVLAHIRERQIERAEARSHSAQRRQGQVSHMFKVG